MAGRPSKYPWETWLMESTPNGKTLTAGIHFPETTRPSSLRTQLYAQAALHGYRISVSIADDAEPVRVTLWGTRIGDVTALFDGDQHVVAAGDLNMPAFDYIALLQREADKRGLKLRATADDLGNVIMKSAKPS